MRYVCALAVTKLLLILVHSFYYSFLCDCPVKGDENLIYLSFLVPLSSLFFSQFLNDIQCIQICIVFFFHLLVSYICVRCPPCSAMCTMYILHTIQFRQAMLVHSFLLFFFVFSEFVRFLSLDLVLLFCHRSTIFYYIQITIGGSRHILQF